MIFKILFIFMIVILAMVLIACKKGQNVQLTIFQHAPNFNLLDDQGNERTLQEFLGKNIVLYFYPKDDTPGCTKEACAFRDSYHDYIANDIVVLGINYDSPESHAQFKKKYHLPFTLLSDTNREIAKRYGAYTNMTHYLFPKRITFLINKQGDIVNVLENIDVTQHAKEILNYFNEIKL